MKPRRARSLLILTYHRVLPEADPMRPGEMTRTDFRIHARVLQRWFNVVSLRDGWRACRDGQLPPRAVAITFDDGYADNVEVAMPVLLESGLTATFFIATGYLNDGLMWNDQIIEVLRQCAAPLDTGELGPGRFELSDAAARSAAADALIRAWKHLEPVERQRRVDALARQAGVPVPRNLMMKDEGVRILAAAGMDIGAHTVSHPILLKLDDAAARREIEHSRVRLEQISGRRVELFAYPNGRRGEDYEDRHAVMLPDLGFELGVSTQDGAANPDSDPFQLPRFAPWPESAWRFAARLWRYGL